MVSILNIYFIDIYSFFTHIQRVSKSLNVSPYMDTKCVVPTSANLYPDPGNPEVPANMMWFQQNGAPMQCPAVPRRHISKSVNREARIDGMASVIT